MRSTVQGDVRGGEKLIGLNLGMKPRFLVQTL